MMAVLLHTPAQNLSVNTYIYIDIFVYVCVCTLTKCVKLIVKYCVCKKYMKRILIYICVCVCACLFVCMLFFLTLVMFSLSLWFGVVVKTFFSLGCFYHP